MLFYLINISFILIISGILFYYFSNQKRKSLMVICSGLCSLLISSILLLSCGLVAFNNMSTIKIDDFKYEDESYIFTIENLEYTISNYNLYDKKEVNEEEGLYVAIHKPGKYERFMYGFFLDKETEIIINEVYFVIDLKGVA